MGGYLLLTPGFLWLFPSTGNAVSLPVSTWLGQRLAAPYAYKYHGVGVADRRMDHLLDEGEEAAPR